LVNKKAAHRQIDRQIDASPLFRAPSFFRAFSIFTFPIKEVHLKRRVIAESLSFSNIQTPNAA
jgi:hypothetical protein